MVNFKLFSKIVDLGFWGRVTGLDLREVIYFEILGIEDDKRILRVSIMKKRVKNLFITHTIEKN